MYLLIARRERIVGSAVVRRLSQLSSPASEPLSRRSGMGGILIMKSGRPTGAGPTEDPEEITDDVMDEVPFLDATEAFSAA